MKLEKKYLKLVEGESCRVLFDGKNFYEQAFNGSEELIKNNLWED